MIYLQNIYSGKADDKVSEYKNYADLHWDFEHWILHYEDWDDPESEFYSLFSDPNGNCLASETIVATSVSFPYNVI